MAGRMDRVDESGLSRRSGAARETVLRPQSTLSTWSTRTPAVTARLLAPSS
jgi:hypothetical protein